MVKVTDFTETPGARYRSDGKYSGEEFREEYLKPHLLGGEKIIVDLDGTYGYPTSFLEEAFGGLARDMGAKKILESIEFISNEDPYLHEEIINYVKNTEK